MDAGRREPTRDLHNQSLALRGRKPCALKFFGRSAAQQVRTRSGTPRSVYRSQRLLFAGIRTLPAEGASPRQQQNRQWMWRSGRTGEEKVVLQNHFFSFARQRRDQEYKPTPALRVHAGAHRGNVAATWLIQT
jgi:hypothetical protein